MFGLGAGEMILVGVIALVFIGPKKLPELARGLGKGLREFQKAKDDLQVNIIEEARREKLASILPKTTHVDSKAEEVPSAVPSENKAEV